MTKIVALIFCLVAPVIAHAETVERFGRIEIDTAIDLPAPPEAVWHVVADIGRYGEWNPYHVRVAGRLDLGEKLEVRVVKPNGNELTIHPHVLEMVEDRSLVWGGGPRGVFRGVHRFDLEPVSATCTRLHHTEVFAGLFVSFAELGSIEEGYRGMNEALRNRLAEMGYDGQAAACDV